MSHSIDRKCENNHQKGDDCLINDKCVSSNLDKLSLLLKQYLDNDDGNLSVHDDDLPEVGVVLVPVVQEAILRLHLS